MLTDKQIIDKYGEPGDNTKITTIKLAYPMRIAWMPTKLVHTMQCHELLSSQFMNVFSDLQAHYGLAEIQRLGIDLFGGCLNVRAQRGTEKRKPPLWSRHSWGIAIDLDPARNGLKTTWEKAQFSKPEYKAMIDIFYKHGFFSYGKARNFDPMHFEINS